MTTSTQFDVIVVGAGATGLTSAWRLAEAGKSVLVLEARDRVGGRLRNDSVDGQLFELGGQWVSPDQTALIGLLAELGLQTFSRYREGRSVYIDDSGVRRLYDDVLPVGPESQEQLNAIAQRLDDLAAAMDPDAPWQHPDAAELDAITFEQWLESQSADVCARQLAAMFVGQALLTKPARSFSALQAVYMAASAGSFSNLLDEDVILDKRVVGGLQQVPLKLAALLGERVRLGADVSKIEWDEGHAVVSVAGERLIARSVVVAVPPTLVQRIAFEPQLPEEISAAQGGHTIGMVIKVQVRYENAFWRSVDLSGTGFGPNQIVHEVYDNTPEGDTGGVLVGFVSDDSAEAVGLLTPDERQAKILEAFANYFGDDALRPKTYVESDWQLQELTGGAYGTSFGVGGLTRHGPSLLKPAGAISFGSSDLAGKGFQHVEGAVQMGERLATQVLLRLAIVHRLDHPSTVSLKETS